MSSAEHKVVVHQLVTERKKAGKPVWEYTLDLSFIELDPDENWEAYRDQVAIAIKNSSWYAAKGGDEDTPLWVLWDEFKDAETREHGGYVFDALYDEADYDRCWIKTT